MGTMSARSRRARATLAFGMAGNSAPAQVQATALIGGHFALTTLSGAVVTERTYLGKWQLIYFGYTSCPDVCPAVLSDMGVALDSLGPLANKIQPIFISIDPVRDTTRSVAAFLHHFNPRIVGLVGTTEQTNEAARSYRVYYKTRSLGDGAYTVDHSSFLFLMKPDGELGQLLSGDLPTHKLADEIRKQVR